MKRVFTVLVSLVLIVTAFLTTGVPTVQAVVEDGWPAGTPNTPKNPDDILIDFEAGIEGVEIESTIPSVQFTTTYGLNWRYGDIRTGEYNVYPYGSTAYETNGNFFAWLGITGDTGRIDFPGGGATYFSALVSTASGLVFDAYNSEDELISTSGWANDNIYTRTFARLTVEAPEGEIIAYVMIHDTGNYWLIDDICTDAQEVVIPVPGRPIGNHSDKFDIVFVPDEDYGSPADIDTWLPTFLDHINDQIDQRLGGKDPVTGNLDKFNFYYTRMQGTASSKTLPANLTLCSSFADAYVIFHNAVFGDSTSMATPSIYGAEGPIGRSFIHESGHGIFGLADEYDGCGTHYFEPNPMPNIWETEADGRADATSEGWDPDDIWKFTECQGDWWKLGTTEYIMFDGDEFDNGWGEPAARRIRWFLDQFPDASEMAEASPQAEKAIWLNLQVSMGVFSLVGESFVTDSPPNYLPGEYDFTANVFSNGGELLGEYGFNDPRRIIAESDYVGPTWLDDTNFQLIVPYFNQGDRVDLIESATGGVMISVDISQYTTTLPDTTPPSIAMVSPTSGSALQDGVTFIASVTDDESGVASVTFSIREDDGGTGIPVGFEDLPPDSYNAGTGIATLDFDTLQLPDGYYLVVISATDVDGNSNSIAVPYSIRNWAVLEMLPATPNNKARRTMPVKFSLRVSGAVDPNQPFVYNEDLTIKVYVTSNPSDILQTSVFGSGSQGYRIDEQSEHYITNFKTSKVPEMYAVEIWRTSNNFMVGSFTFKTVK